MKTALHIIAAITMVVVINAAPAQTTAPPPNGVTEKEFATIRAHCAQNGGMIMKCANSANESSSKPFRNSKSRGPIDQR
jgi:hypothetical protein